MTDTSTLYHAMSAYREDYELRVQPMMGNLDHIETFSNPYDPQTLRFTWAKPGIYRLIKESFPYLSELHRHGDALRTLIE